MKNDSNFLVVIRIPIKTNLVVNFFLELNE